MKVLNGYQWRVLRRAAEYEVETDYRLHGAMKHETGELLAMYDEKYTQMPRDEREILYDTLIDLYDFWALYFISPREAERIWQLQEEQHMNDVRAQVKLNFDKMCKELDEMLGIIRETEAQPQEDEPNE